MKERHGDWSWEIPKALPDEGVLGLAHSPEMLKRLGEPRDFDGDTPYFPDIGQHAKRAVAAALRAMDVALERPGVKAFSLMRPPGHHATANQAMGFCYLNQIAIAALAARARGVQRVAVWDFDAHHGNGTEAILEGRKGFRFCSVHQFPGYPGTGTRSTATCFNWPVAPDTPAEKHLEALEKSWQKVVEFQPELVLVSAGFDAYAGDPITAMTLQTKHFEILGGWLREAGCPVAALLEGGYARELPLLIDAFLSSWEGVAAGVGPGGVEN